MNSIFLNVLITMMYEKGCCGLLLCYDQPKKKQQQHMYYVYGVEGAINFMMDWSQQRGSVARVRVIAVTAEMQPGSMATSAVTATARCTSDRGTTSAAAAAGVNVT